MVVVRFYGLTLFLMVLSKAHNMDDDVKNVLVNDIVHKLYNISSTALSETSPDVKDNIIKNIKFKLKLSAKPFGIKADKYVELVMEGLRIMLYNNSQIESFHYKPFNMTTKSPLFHNVLRILNKTNDLLANQISEKVLIVVKKYLNTGNTSEERYNIFQNIRNKVLETAKIQHDTIHTKQEVKAYTDLITHGMQLMMENLDQSKRKMIVKDTFVGNNNGLLNVANDEQFEVSTPDDMYYGGTTPTSCETVVVKICTDIQLLNRYVCPNRGKVLALNKLCDGVDDCPMGSDEKQCLEQVLSLMQRASNVMAQVETNLLKDCFIFKDTDLIIKQNFILNKVLRKQLDFLQKQANRHKTKASEDTISIKKTLNEVIVLINSLALTVHGSLCTPQMHDVSKIDEMIDKKISTLEDDLTSEGTGSKITIKNCSCVESFCIDIPCPQQCKSVCWHRFNLGRWGCQAVDESTSVSLDVLCDGKLDCYDETDEMGCNTGASINKFEANEMYDKVLQVLQSKRLSKEYTIVHGKLLLLYNTVNELQRATLASNINIANIKILRNNSFSYLSSIYEDVISKASALDELYDIQLFLLTVNEKLGAALKLSQTGNVKIITRTGCVCREYRCLTHQCSKSCQIACSVKPKLTKYWCQFSLDSNISVPLERVCNGKADCPYEDDETQCVRDICRKHHLLMLRQSIQDVGEKQKGTSLGESLIAWKTKTTATLKIAENNFRPTPNTLRDVIDDILNDLVMSYAALEQNINSNKKSNDYIVKTFMEISQMLVQSLRSCGQ